MRRPAFQFYPADWRKDPALSACSLAARGLWIELICIAHESERYGHLAINDKPMTVQQIARMVGESPATISKLIAELESAAVFSRSEDGSIFSRRMVSDEHIRNVRAEAGRLGGNPNLLKQKVKQKVKQTDEQNLTPSSSSSSSSSIHPLSPHGGGAGKPAASAQAPLPDWIPADAWAGYVEMRRTRKKPMTARALQMIVKALDGMRAKGIDLAAVLDASTKNCWTDVYEPKPKPGAEQAAKSIEKSPKWATDAGFPTVWEAENALCFERNAHEFRDGKRIGVAA